MMDPTPQPELSVVVALISGKVERLAACLRALHTQSEPPPFETIVPYDATVSAVTQLQAEFPGARFVLADGLDTAAARAGASREYQETLRAIGIKAARGQIIALTEDHATMQSTWCRDMVALLRAHPDVGALGGAVECGSDRLLNRAVYYCDFGRYQNPLPEGPAQFVSDSNVVYRREALEAVRDTWEKDYHEPEVHAALVKANRQLWLTPRTVVWQARGHLTFAQALHERFVWGQSFAGTRAAGASTTMRLVYAVLSWLLPVLLTYRIIRGAVQRRRADARFVQALPLVFLLSGVWAIGEFVGYVRGRPK